MTAPQPLLRIRMPHLGQSAQREELFVLDRSSVTIGRARDQNVVLLDPRVSRIHARLDRGPEGWVIRDLGSTAGVYVDGQRCDRTALRDGQTITLGNTTLVLVLDPHRSATVAAESSGAVEPSGRPRNKTLVGIPRPPAATHDEITLETPAVPRAAQLSAGATPSPLHAPPRASAPVTPSPLQAPSRAPATPSPSGAAPQASAPVMPSSPQAPLQAPTPSPVGAARQPSAPATPSPLHASPRAPATPSPLHASPKAPVTPSPLQAPPRAPATPSPVGAAPQPSAKASSGGPAAASTKSEYHLGGAEDRREGADSSGFTWGAPASSPAKSPSFTADFDALSPSDSPSRRGSRPGMIALYLLILGVEVVAVLWWLDLIWLPL